MDTKTNSVYTHFNDVDQYLHQGFDIKVRSEIVREMVGTPERADILDCGCGDGTISLQFQAESNYITLVDISENMLDRARLNIRPDFSDQVELCLTEAGSFHPSKKYDLVLGIGLLAHVDSVSKTIESLARLLKPGGYCLLQLTDEAQFFSKFLKLYNRMLDKVTNQFGYVRNRLSFSQVVSIAKQYGLEYVESRQYSLSFPGFTSFLPNKIMYPYHSYVRKNSFLSSFGSDFIIKYQKK